MSSESEQALLFAHEDDMSVSLAAWRLRFSTHYDTALTELTTLFEAQTGELFDPENPTHMEVMYRSLQHHIDSMWHEITDAPEPDTLIACEGNFALHMLDEDGVSLRPLIVEGHRITGVFERPIVQPYLDAAYFANEDNIAFEDQDEVHAAYVRHFGANLLLRHVHLIDLQTGAVIVDEGTEQALLPIQYPDTYLGKVG